MGTRMLLFPGDEHIHRAPSSWAGMHDSDGGNPSWMGYSQSSGGNTWSKRLAATSNDDSWEVRAFAEDASTSGQWPPRSYSCSFCQREFRTAQALGGHMNVHRRERAQANQLAQLRSHTGTDAHNSNNSNTNSTHNNNSSSNNNIDVAPPPDHHWLHQQAPGGHDHHHHPSYPYPYGHHSSSSSRASYASSTNVEDSYPATSYGAPSFRNSSPYESAWRYDTPRDSGLDLELRLGQRYN